MSFGSVKHKSGGSPSDVPTTTVLLESASPSSKQVYDSETRTKTLGHFTGSGLDRSGVVSLSPRRSGPESGTGVRLRRDLGGEECLSKLSVNRRVQTVSVTF